MAGVVEAGEQVECVGRMLLPGCCADPGRQFSRDALVFIRTGTPLPALSEAVGRVNHTGHPVRVFAAPGAKTADVGALRAEQRLLSDDGGPVGVAGVVSVPSGAGAGLSSAALCAGAEDPVGPGGRVYGAAGDESVDGLDLQPG